MSNENLNLWLEDLYGENAGLKIRLRDCLHSSTSPFQRIAVYDSQAFGKVLTLGGSIALSDFDEALYSECIVHPTLSVLPSAESVLILGGGDGGVAREVLRYSSVKKVTVVEIDKEVIDVCRKYFPSAASCLSDERIELIIDDAHRYLRDCPHQFDLIIVDACELTNTASDVFHATSFADTVFQRLSANGALVAPLGCPTFSGDECRSTSRKLAEHFTNIDVYLMTMPSFPGGEWAVARCHGSELGTTVKAQDWHGSLRCWHPNLQTAMFGLPRYVQRALGLI